MTPDYSAEECATTAQSYDNRGESQTAPTPPRALPWEGDGFSGVYRRAGSLCRTPQPLRLAFSATPEVPKRRSSSAATLAGGMSREPSSTRAWNIRSASS